MKTTQAQRDIWREALRRDGADLCRPPPVEVVLALLDDADWAARALRWLRVAPHQHECARESIVSRPDACTCGLHELLEGDDETRTTTEIQRHVLSAVNAVLPVLPTPLRLRHGPLLVTLEVWSDGTTFARLPCAAIHGTGDSDAAALEDLGTVVLDFAGGVLATLARGDTIAGPLKSDWDNLTALVDVSGLSGSRRSSTVSEDHPCGREP